MDASKPWVTGLGVISTQGAGKSAFLQGLLDGRTSFDVMAREGRQHDTSRFLGAELVMPTASGAERTLSLSARVALTVVAEAWCEAGLDQLDPMRVGLIIGGNNVQQREQVLVHDAFRERRAFVRPTYGLGFMDTDLAGVCSAHFGICGAAFTVGGASASGQLAIIQAHQMVASGQVDACVAVGALMDLSYWECSGFRALGAMGSTQFAYAPMHACRPFDARHDGFIFGECSAAMVLESRESAMRRGRQAYASLAGWGLAMDANRQPDPSVEGEVRAITDALRRAAWQPGDVGYVNPHGTGSVIGDETELAALRTAGLGGVAINATKSLTGHGLTAAGTVEAVATLLQLRAGQLHPTANLEAPIADDFRWVREGAVSTDARRALSLSMGFGGINTALCWEMQS